MAKSVDPFTRTQRERETALAGPIDLKEPGSPEWIWQKLYLLKVNWERVEDTHQIVQELEGELRRHRAWEKVPPDRPYGTWERLVENELGVPAPRYRSKLDDCQARAETLAGKTINAGDGPRTDEERDNCDYITVRQDTRGGTSADYLTRRIARDRPDILERMKEGAYKSVRQAALEAGIVKPTITVPREPEAIARILKRHLTSAEILALIELLASSETRD